MRPSRLHTTTLCVSSAISAARRLRSCSISRLASRTALRDVVAQRAALLHQVVDRARPAPGCSALPCGARLALRRRWRPAPAPARPGAPAPRPSAGQALRASAPSPPASSSQTSSSSAARGSISAASVARSGRRRAWPAAARRRRAPSSASSSARRERGGQLAAVDLHHAPTAEQLAHPLGQLRGREGLGHVGVGAERQALGDVGVAALGGEHQDLHARPATRRRAPPGRPRSRSCPASSRRAAPGRAARRGSPPAPPRRRAPRCTS